MFPSESFVLVLIAKVASAYIVAIPKNAIIHIQNIAPGPPTKIAPDAPTIFPVPTCEAIAVDKD